MVYVKCLDSSRALSFLIIVGLFGGAMRSLAGVLLSSNESAGCDNLPFQKGRIMRNLQVVVSNVTDPGFNGKQIKKDARSSLPKF